MSNATASLLHNGTANAMLTTTNTTADFNYAGVVFSRVCPGNNQADIIRASKSHMNPYQLLFLACLTVAGFRLLPELKKLFRRAELCFCDLNGDGKVDEKDIDVCLKKCCRGGGGCRKRKKQNVVVPVDADGAAAADNNEKDNSSRSPDLEKGDGDATGQGKEDDLIKWGVSSPPQSEHQEKEDTQRESTFITSKTVETAKEAIGGGGSGNDEVDEMAAEAKKEGDSVLQGWLNIVYTFLYGYSTFMYMKYAGLANVSGDIGNVRTTEVLILLRPYAILRTTNTY